MSRSRPDFVEVQLSGAGEAFAGDGRAILFANGRMHYRFASGERTEVLRSEWTHVLSKEHSQGEPLFELAPEFPLPAAQPVEGE